MPFQKYSRLLVLVFFLLSCAGPLLAQQKGQWLPGQMGLNAGVMPEPGFTLINIDLNYSAAKLNDRNGNALPITGSYDIWAVENGVFYVPKFKFLGGKFGFMIMQPTFANGSLTVPKFGASGGGSGFADTYIQPVTLGWSMKRLDFYTGYAFVAPTGRYTPGASDNIGSGYWGNNWLTGTTLYLTKNKGTSANLFTNYEFHGSKQGTGSTRITPGQTFTTEWGFGQALPLKKDLSVVALLGGVGYDQWQVSTNGGTIQNPIPLGQPLPASGLPFYSVHAVGLQANLIAPPKGLIFNFKYYWEYSARSHPLGHTLAFGATWTIRVPKSQKH